LSVARAGNPQGKFVCFTSGTDKKTSVKRLREQPAKTFSILNIDRVQISGIGVQNISLIALFLCNIWMRMTHMSNIVDAVQIKRYLSAANPRMKDLISRFMLKLGAVLF